MHGAVWAGACRAKNEISGSTVTPWTQLNGAGPFLPFQFAEAYLPCLGTGITNLTKAVGAETMPIQPVSPNERFGFGERDESAQVPNDHGRRSFLGALLAAGAAGVGALLFLPVVRFVLHPVLAKTTEKSWSDVGSVGEFESTAAPVQRLILVEQLDGWRKTVLQKPVYVVRDSAGRLAVLSAVCTHLGCTVPWLEKQNKFICPCHQATFDGAGKLIGGPAPRGMDVLPVKIEQGILKVQYQFFRQLISNKEVVA